MSAENLEGALPLAPATPRRKNSMARRLSRKPLVWLCLAWIVIIIVASVGGPLLAPYDPLQQDVDNIFSLPSASHLLGTDSIGRDILSRLMFAGSHALLASAEVVVVALIIGYPLGLLAGYFGGIVDSIVARISDVLMAIPAIIVLLAVVAAVGNNLTIAMATLGVVLSASFMRLARSATLEVRNELYVDAARVAGLRSLRILVRHIFPNTLAPTIILASLTFASGLLVQSGLGFIGLGPTPPEPDWGAMVYEASQNISRDPWMMVPSGLMLIITILAFNTLGDVLGEVNSIAAAPHVRRAPRSRAAIPALDPNAPLLAVEGLSVSFGAGPDEHRVVSDISFSVERGEVLGVVGESGSGKTMTALAIMDLLPSGGRVSSGSVRFQGVDLTESAAIAEAHRGKRLAMISQEPMVALDPSFTIGSQLAEPLRVHRGLSRRAARLEAIALLQRVGIDRAEQVYSSYPHQISGGMAQRVCIAIALSGEPELLIADEPTTALDVTVQAEILELLRSLQAETSMAIVLVTHNLGVVADICDRTVVMYAGEVVESCDTDDLFTAPAHPYTKGLLASAPDRAAPGVPLPAIPGIVPIPEQWPVGCHFAERCPLATEACRTSGIPLLSLPDEDTLRTSRCIRIPEALALEVAGS